MAVTRQKKIEQGEQLAADLQNTSNLIVGSYNKLTVSQDFELRKTVRAAGGKYRVVKNTIARRASKGTQVEEVLQDTQGRHLDRLHGKRPGRAGEGADQIHDRPSRIFGEGGHRRRARRLAQ